MRMKPYLYSSLICLFILSGFWNKSFASHLYGGEMYYTHISGNKYTVTMVLYGDCSGSSTLISALYTASPKVQVYNGTTLFRTMNLIVAPGAGAEVTPVCPLSLDSTTCHGGTIPGVRRFVYSDTITLLPSTSWKFRSTSYLTASSSAGRSSTITNIFSPGSSLMSLEATLNNNTQANSNPTYTTIPTPFFCINVSQEYNIGAVDSNTSDSIVYSLVDGLDATTTPSSTVSYRPGYSATAPLACATGSFTFSTSTGQLTFKPNLAQVSLVVYKVSEYRGGVLVGTSMREMNFIVLSTCSNRSPYGKISGVAGGTATDNTTVNMCKNDTLLTFNINPVDSDGNNINVTYEGLPTGATLSITGNNTTNPSCAFSWNTSTVAAGTYYFYVTYQDNACPLSSKQTVVYTINVLPKPGLTVSTVSLTTCTKKNVFDIIPSGSGSPWTVKILNGSTLIKTYTALTASKRDSLPVGTYTFTISNANGCYNDVNYVINPPPAISIQSATIVHPKCYGSSDGSITIVANSGLTPYRYSLNGGAYSGSGVFSALTAGTYTLQIRDTNECTKDTVIILNNPDSIIATASSKPALCNAFSSGSITILASGGSGTLTYAIGAGGTFGSSNIFSSLFSGTYVLKVKDTNNCIKTISSIVTDSIMVVAASVTKSNVLCFAGNNGSISVSPTNGLAPYTYAIDAGAFGSSSSFTSLTANNYTVHIKDSLGCFLDTIVAITQPTKLNISVALTHVGCFGGNTGAILASGSGAITPYTFALNSGAFSSTPTFTSLTAGVYTVTIKDSNNCTKDTSATITQPNPITINGFSVTIPKCVGSADGIVTISAIGGTGSLKYTIDGGIYSAISTFTGLTAGTHTISIKDSNNCIKDTMFNLNNPNPIVIQSFNVVKPKCYGGSDGTTDLVAIGGAGAFKYSIDAGPFGSSGSFTGLSAGTHTISIKDANNCLKDTTYILLNTDSITFNAFIRKNLCNTSKNGAVRLTASGGSGAYTFEKNGSGIFTTTVFYDSLASGIYTFTVKDAKNCTKTISVEIVDSMRVSTEIAITDVSCFGGNDGVISLSPLTGISPFAYAIGTGTYGSSSSFGSLAKGTYTLHIVDSKGCLLDTFASITEPTKLSLSLSLIPPSCYGLADGSITITGSEGTAPYTYAIDASPYGSIATFSGLSAKSYTMHIKDAKGCIKDSIVTLTQPEAIFMNLTIKTPLCNGDANGSVVITANGGTPGYQYAIDASAPQADALFANLKSGNYIIKVIDSKGCIKDSSISINEPAKLKVDRVTIVNPTCENYEDGAILITATGALKPYSFAMETAQYSAINYFEKLKENQYTIHIKDSNNCTVDTLIQLTGYPKIKLDSSFAKATKCFGTGDGALSLYASGGNQPLRYSIENLPDTFQHAHFENLKSKNYLITVIDTTNCFKSFSVFVPQPEKLIIGTDVVNNDCTGVDSSGRLSAVVKGGTLPYEYRWSVNSANDSSISYLPNGSYMLYVKDANQCSDSTSAIVTYDNCCTPSLPNAFTPNNDGKNDIFRIIYKGDLELKEFSIYNRYGQRVYSSNILNQGWDGNFNNQEAELGVYYYQIRLICGNMKNHEIFLKGDVTLIR